MGKTKKIGGKHTQQQQELTSTHEEKDELQFAEVWNATTAFFTHKTTITVLLLIIAIFASVIFRMYPENLPATTTWAEQNYYGQIRGEIANQVAAQYPNLPADQRNAYVEEQFQAQLEQLGPQLQPQIEATANYFKDQLQNEDGQTYLLAIDPYLWLSLAENYIEYGYFGDEIVDGQSSFSLRNGREFSRTGTQMHPLLIGTSYKLFSIFNSQLTILRVAFIAPVVIIALAVVFAFLLGKELAGTVGGFIAGLTLGLNTALLGRTPAGFSDTDAYIVLFPLIMGWLLFKALKSDTINEKLLWAGGVGTVGALFMIFWTTGWHMPLIIFAVLGIYFMYLFIREHLILKKKTKNYLNPIYIGLVILGTFIFFSGLFGSLTSHNNFFESVYNIGLSPFTQPLNALTIKNVGGADIWPNVLTTVAELNPGEWPQIIGSVGGKLFFFIGILGILACLSMYNQQPKISVSAAALLLIWSSVLVVASLMSARFLALLAAPFAIAFGAFFGILWKHAKNIPTKDLRVTALIAIIVIMGVLFINPVKAAHQVGLQEIPSMDDTWYTALQEIGADTNQGYITSWWDFGHWFVNVAREHVTFDGGDQGRRIHWVGKLLLTNDAQENKAILRMLNCGQDKGYERILEATTNQLQATRLINEIIMQTREEAQATLKAAGLSGEQINSVLEKTHCANEELYDQYVIASQDMIGKAGVWAHFGSWNFDRAYIYHTVRKQPYEQALQTMAEMGITDEEYATQLYLETQNLRTSRQVDDWIAPWPGYVSQSAYACENRNGTIGCPIRLNMQQTAQGIVALDQLFVYPENMEESHLLIGVYQGANRVATDTIKPAKLTVWEENKWVTYTFANATFSHELIVGPNDAGQLRTVIAEDAIADSMFTKMFFFDGRGLDGYEKFSDYTSFRGQRIITYKVDLGN